MARASDGRSGQWTAFAAGAVVMLIVALLWGVWMSRAAPGGALRLAATVAQDAPQIPLPRMPDAPRLPGVPLPTPK